MHRVRILAAVLALTIPALAHADAADEGRAYGESAYTYCDAKLLSGLWRQSVGDSKLQIGRKLLANDQASITTGLVQARKKAAANPALRCTFGEAGFSFADAQKLAKVWKTTPADAKARAEVKILHGGEATVRAIMQGEDLAAFVTGSYTYCDAKLLAGLWSRTITDAKAFAGAKLRRPDGRAAVERALADARVNAMKKPRDRCTLADAGFTFGDAEKLAKLWRKPVGAAKAMMERKLLAAGGEAQLHALLDGKPLAAPPPPPPAASYTYCDAKLLAAAWKQSLAEAKALAADKVAAGNTADVETALDTGRKLASRNKKLRCSFAEAGFTLEDAGALAKAWGNSTLEAKAVVEDKLLFKGGEGRVRALLARTPK